MDITPIQSTHNERVRRLRQLATHPRDCRREGLLIADGIHLIQEALATGLRCESLVVDVERADHPEIVAILEEARRRSWPEIPVVPRVLRAISPVETPQGILGCFQRPRSDRDTVLGSSPSEAIPGRSPHLVVTHRIQDPSNIGAITRSALAAGMRALVSTPGTVDPFHPRALRASMGAAFRLPILPEQPLVSLRVELRKRGLRTVALSPRGTTRIEELDPTHPHALILGSEGAGLEKDAERDLDLQVRIPTQPEVESLGVAAAAAVAFYWLCRFGLDA